MNSPIEKIMEPAKMCKVFTPDIVMHWFPEGSEVGDRCFCGEAILRRENPIND